MTVNRDANYTLGTPFKAQVDIADEDGPCPQLPDCGCGGAGEVILRAFKDVTSGSQWGTSLALPFGHL